MVHIIKDSIRVSILSFIISVSVYFAFAQTGSWSEPTASPPGGNVLTPLHAGVNPQSKLGELTLGDLNLTGSLFSNGSRVTFFGGLYYTAGAGGSGTCLSSNPVTGGCSCSAGFTNSEYYVYQAGGINCGWTAGYTATVPCYGQYVTIHQCWK